MAKRLPEVNPLELITGPFLRAVGSLSPKTLLSTAAPNQRPQAKAGRISIPPTYMADRQGRALLLKQAFAHCERHPKLDPVMTMVEGIYIAGACQAPMAIPESVAQASAATARVMGVINQKTVMMEPVKASIDPERCSGCRICNNLCPYSAIIFHEDRKESEVLTALCQGCGTCVAACPSAAISGAHFTHAQIMSQIEGILWDVREASPEPIEVHQPTP